MSEAPGSAVSPNAPQTSSTLLLPPQITPQGNQLPMIAATGHAPRARREHQARPTRPARTLSVRPHIPGFGQHANASGNFLFCRRSGVVVSHHHSSRPCASATISLPSPAGGVWRLVGMETISREKGLFAAKGEDALSAGSGITGVQAIPPADSWGDEVGQGDVAVIRGGDLDLREPDAQVEVPGLGAAAFLEQVEDVRRLAWIEAGVHAQPIPPVQPRRLGRVDELPSVQGTAVRR